MAPKAYFETTVRRYLEGWIVDFSSSLELDLPPSQAWVVCLRAKRSSFCNLPSNSMGIPTLACDRDAAPCEFGLRSYTVFPVVTRTDEIPHSLDPPLLYSIPTALLLALLQKRRYQRPPLLFCYVPIPAAFWRDQALMFFL